MIRLIGMRAACFAAAMLGLGAAAHADQPSTQPSGTEDLRAEVEQLKAEVNDLKSRDSDFQADRMETIKQVLADADSQSNPQITAGYANRRFFIQSADGNFVFRPWIHIQARYSDATRLDAKGGASTLGNGTGTTEDTQDGFEIRRARLGFDGNLFTPDLAYFINWATYRENSNVNVNNSSGAKIGTANIPIGGLPVLEEAWIKYNIHDTPYFVKVGQMHDPLDHENIVGSKYRAPEASLQGDVFGNTDTFTQAATFIYDNKGPIRFEGGVTDGIRAANTNFQDFPTTGINFDGGVAGRVEYKAMGNWKDYDQMTSLNDKTDLLVLGSGYDYSYGGDFYMLTHTADVQYANPQGWFAYVCYLGRYTERNPGILSGGPVSTSFGSAPGDLHADTYEPSIDGQFAYLIDNKLEPYVRYEYLHLAGTPAGSQNNVTDISLGANYYFFGHNLKFTGQVMYLPTGIPVSDDSSDVLLSNGKGEFVVITQLQFLL